MDRDVLTGHAPMPHAGRGKHIVRLRGQLEGGSKMTAGPDV